ncbi:DedA family protein [Streptomyces sp. NPDC001339]|uniref:DedA family protein n=1 Tax=Streptomyces sp. NPDC001339 TaxID=3364563 RepID=UPI00369B1024
MTALATALGGVPDAVGYLILTAAVLAESVLLIGAFIPTLTLMLTAGALASTGQLHLLLVIAVAAGAVVTGDFLAHRTGLQLGTRLRTAGIGRRIPTTAWRRAEELMARRGGQAVLIARFVPVLRTLTPHLAGATRLPYRRIAPYSALAAPVWAAAEASAGYTAAASLQPVLTFGAPVVAGLLGVAAAVALWWRARGKAGSERDVKPATSFATSPRGMSSAGNTSSTPTPAGNQANSTPWPTWPTPSPSP